MKWRYKIEYKDNIFWTSAWSKRQAYLHAKIRYNRGERNER